MYQQLKGSVWPIYSKIGFIRLLQSQNDYKPISPIVARRARQEDLLIDTTVNIP
jgi:hypothetical protein